MQFMCIGGGVDARSMLRDLCFNSSYETAPEVRMPEVFGDANCKAYKYRHFLVKGSLSSLSECTVDSLLATFCSLS